MTTPACFAPVHAHSGEPVSLALQRLWLTGQVLPAGARLTVQHIFRSAEASPLEVIYSFPLPRDAALRRFRIVGDGFEAHSELRETAAAVKAYEEGIAQGSLATLARQYGDGVINLTVGNIRPGEQITVFLELLAGVELRDDGFRLRFPFTLAPTYHAQARCAVVDGDGEMELPASEFGDVILPRFRSDASALHQIGFELTVESGLEVDELGSPSHAVRVKRENAGTNRVALGAEKDIPNRDLVLDAHYREIAPQVLAGKDKFAAVIPSTSFGVKEESPRRVVILLDRSGSMQGAPIQQAARAIDACLAALSDTDWFGLAAFDDKVEVCDPRLLSGTRENRDRAHRWLEAIDARGGTELVGGFRKAVELLERGGGDVLILTDGQVAGTGKILAEARLTNTRLHCLGIGSASQDRFLALLARETGGVSRFVTASERVDLPAVDLFASIGRPVAAQLKAKGADPEPPAAVFAGTPVLLFGEGERVELTWAGGGTLTIPVETRADLGDTVALLQGARLITDWESRYPSVEALAPLAQRQQSRVAIRLRELSETYGLASREMSLVAVVKREDDRAGKLPETRVVPVGMAVDTKFSVYFGAPKPVAALPVGMSMPALSAMSGGAIPPPMQARGRTAARKVEAFFGESAHSAPPAPPNSDDLLLALASALDADGGMPGNSINERAAASAVALLAFASNGHSPSHGAFRGHAARLERFLESLSGLDASRQRLIARVLETVRKDAVPWPNWLAFAGESGDHLWGLLKTRVNWPGLGPA